ncbi:NAD(P)/FAD-dependent oxidoreductase [Ekhidna sp. To15]|uniref:NAD(P)/FAD-dependent oxidoreductase n=1 Tax=Ekhidna sp. To15 TaxID=3395267 RepID=UPI003F527EFC
MRTTKVDYIIVGQGLAGSWLALEMEQQALSFVVINEDKPETSSKKAAGIYNPITGRKMIKTWRADQLFPTLEQQYQKLEKLVDNSFLHPTAIYRPFKTIEDQNDWDGKIADGAHDAFLKQIHKKSLGLSHVLDELGGIMINKSGYVDIPVMLEAVQNYLKDKGYYHSEVFDYERMEINSDFVSYKDYQAKKVIFCEGSLSDNPYWDLPFKPVRGEIIDITCDLQSDYIINQGVFMIPKGGRYTVGSTYDHQNLTYQPQESGIKSLEERLKKLYSGKYKIIEKRAGVRPATHDRKPYIGIHQKYKTLAIFNGFGTKGVSLTPYFAKHFVDVLQGKSEIDEEVNVQRVI